MRRVLILFLCATLVGCAGKELPIGGAKTISVVSTGLMPVPDRTDMTTDERPYYIGPFDKLTIGVLGVDDLKDQDVLVDSSGRISYPLVGTVEVGGKTPAEVAGIIRTQLRAKYIRNPEVTVNLRETGSRIITIDGQVREPGLYPVVGRLTLMRAVATAKGLSEFAKLDDVVVFRTVQGQQYAALYNLKAIRRGAYDDPEVFADDIVVVGDSKGRRMFKDFLSLTPLLTTPIIIALQNL